MQNPPVLLPIGETISKGWRDVHGTKGPVWGALGLMLLIVLGFVFFGYLFSVLWPGIDLEKILSFISQLIVTLMSFGLMYICLQRTYGRPVSFTMVYQPFSWGFIGRLIVLFLLYIVVLIPVVAILIGAPILLAQYIQANPDMGKLALAACYVVAAFLWLYLMLRMSLAVFYLLDTDKGPWDAVRSSFQATRSNFWRMFWVYILSNIIFIATAITIIALIWTMPMMYLIYAWIYQTLKVNAE